MAVEHVMLVRCTGYDQLTIYQSLFSCDADRLHFRDLLDASDVYLWCVLNGKAIIQGEY